MVMTAGTKDITIEETIKITITKEMKDISPTSNNLTTKMTNTEKQNKQQRSLTILKRRKWRSLTKNNSLKIRGVSSSKSNISAKLISLSLR